MAGRALLKPEPSLLALPLDSRLVHSITVNRYTTPRFLPGL